MVPGGFSGQRQPFGSHDAQPQTRRAGQDHQHGEEALGEHASVADEPGVLLAIELLAGRAAGDEAVESADGAAGDGDEQEGHDERCALGVPLEHRGHDLQRRTRRLLSDRRTARHRGDDQPDQDQSQRADQLQRIDVVAGLQEGPDRQDRRDVGVDQQNAHPGDGRQRGHGVVEAAEQSHVAVDDTDHHQQQGEQ